MQVNDIVYGPVDLAEPVLLELLASRAVQRLHGVLQHGITAVVGVTRPTTRFEHSLGAMLLVRRLGADLHEQIAALLDGQVQPLPLLDPAFAAYRQEYLESKRGQWPMRVVPPPGPSVSRK